MRISQFLIFVLTCFMSSLVARGDELKLAGPNVLLFVCDDLNCDLGCYGHPIVKTPNIDRLAGRGVRFTNAYCQYPLCGPSRCSFMTGLYPDQTLVRRNPVYIRDHLPDVQTLPQMFRNHGYMATRIGKIFHYAVPAQIGTGGHDDPYSWDYTINPRGRDKDEEQKIFSVKPGEYGGYMSWLAAEGTDKEQTDGIAASAAVDLIHDYVQRDRRFFLAVGLYRPHTPYVAPKKYFDLYPPVKNAVPGMPADYLIQLPAPARASLTKKPEHFNIEPKLAQQAMQGYYASISFADAQLGRVLDALDASGASKNTIIVFTSDHGYHMGEHGHWLKTTLFENAARVPLIVATPKMVGGQTASTLAELVDLYPTLAELCQTTPPEYLAGVSLVPALKDPELQIRKSALTQLKNNYTIRTNHFRYTEWGEQGAVGNELYCHDNDSKEMVNLANVREHQATVKLLSQQLHHRITASKQAPRGLEQRAAEKAKIP